MKARPTFWLALILLAALLALGMADRYRLQELRSARAKLLEQALAAGSVVDADQAALPRPSKRPRMDPVPEAKAAAVAFMAYGRDMEAWQERVIAEGGNPNAPDKATRQRMIREIENIRSLDAAQLQILMGEIRDSGDITDRTRQSLLRFAMTCLVKVKPGEALQLLAEDTRLREAISWKTNGAVEVLVFSAAREWSALGTEPLLAWLETGESSLPHDLTDEAIHGLTYGTATRDPRLALDLTIRFGEDTGDFLRYGLASEGQSEDQRLLALGVFREWSEENPDASAKLRGEVLRNLAFGRNHEPESFETATSWIARANLSQEDLQTLCNTITLANREEEAPRWVEWFGAVLPPETAGHRIREFATEWAKTAPGAFAEWFASAPEGLAKREAQAVMEILKLKESPSTAPD